MGSMVGILSRHWFYNPDLYGRNQERRKPMPDRFRQYTYSIPYFNSRIRNQVTRYKWAMIDNEPDFNDNHPLGYRPNRKQSHRRPPLWCFSVPRYSCEDPLYSSTLHANMEQMYQEIGYAKAPASEGDDDE